MKLVQLDEIEPGRVTHASAIIRRVLLGGEDLPAAVRLSHALFRPGESVELHSHDDLFEVFYVLAGQGVLRVGERSHDIDAGSCFIIEPNELHALRNDSDGDLALLYFGLPADSPR